MKVALTQLQNRLESLAPDADWETREKLVHEIAAKTILRQPGRTRKMVSELLDLCADDEERSLRALRWVSELFNQNYRSREALEFTGRYYDLVRERKDSASEIWALEQLGQITMNMGNYGRSLRYYRLLLDFYQMSDDPRGLCHTLTNIGLVYWYLDEYNRSLDYEREALNLAENLEAQDLIAQVYNNIGMVYYRLGSFEEALGYHLRSLSLRETLNLRPGIALSLMNIGIIHRTLKNLTKALETHQQSLTIYQEIGDRRGIAQCLLNIGLVYEDMGDPVKALDFDSRSLRIKQQIGDTKGLAICLGNIGELYFGTGDYPKALEAMRKALALSQFIWDKNQIAHLMAKIGHTFVLIRQFEPARQHLEQGLKIAWEIGSKELVCNFYSVYTIYFSSQQQYADALAYYKRYIEMRDGLQNEKVQQRILELQSKYELEKRDHEARLARSEAEIVHLRNEELANRNRALREANRKLKDANLMIQQQHRELTKAYDRLEQLARFDPLTNIPNRRMFYERAQLEQSRSERTGRQVVLIMGDIDDFKSINDRFGHNAGDYALVTVAQIINHVLRKQDLVARWGGEEFIVLLPESSIHGGEIVGEKVRKAIAEHKFIYKGAKLPITITLGVALLQATQAVAESIKVADDALYEGKRAGKNRVVVGKA